MGSPLASLALDRLRDLIGQPQWRNGGKLPPETELAREVGVSRPVLRQALETLRREGAIESRRGSGNFVHRQRDEKSPVFGHPRNLDDIEKCLRFRDVIESAAAAEAARHHDPTLIAGIEKASAMMEESRFHGQSAFGVELAFHRAVAAASKNHYFVLSLESLSAHIEIGYMLSRQIRNVPPNLTSRRVAQEHRQIFDAIRRGQPETARERMHDHLSAGIVRLFGKPA